MKVTLDNGVYCMHVQMAYGQLPNTSSLSSMDPSLTSSLSNKLSSIFVLIIFQHLRVVLRTRERRQMLQFLLLILVFLALLLGLTGVGVKACEVGHIAADVVCFYVRVG